MVVGLTYWVYTRYFGRLPRLPLLPRHATCVRARRSTPTMQSTISRGHQGAYAKSAYPRIIHRYEVQSDGERSDQSLALLMIKLIETKRVKPLMALVMKK